MREMAVDIFRAAVEGADPARTTTRAVHRVSDTLVAPIAVIALGKAAHAMARAAVDALAELGHEPSDGIIVSSEDQPSPHPALASTIGDHPVPGDRSFAAAESVGELAARIAGRGTVIVLVSGGTSSLLAAPVPGVERNDLTHLFDALLGSGVDIRTMNAVRKRFTRWGAGRLAVALAPARVMAFLISDVVGDDMAAIASGPCVPDPLTTADVRALIGREGAMLADLMPPALLSLLDSDSGFPDTPKPGDAAFRNVSCEVILGNRTACDAAATRARELGCAPVVVVSEPLTDDAALTGDRLVDELIRFREAGLHESVPAADLACMIWGGETVVTLGSADPPPGGRNQELALSAAHAMHRAGDRADHAVLLAAGTDGRDGTTDAAGAVVSRESWFEIERAGREPARDLAEHRANAALDAADALLRTGQSGTNVGDVVVGVVRSSHMHTDRRDATHV
jgi:hydroxypyruvate reductase